MSSYYVSPVGRFVGGDCFVGMTTDAEGSPLLTKSGPNIGQPRTQFIIILAIAKNDPAWPEMAARISEAAKSAFPTLPAAQGPITGTGFAFKVTDGDSTVPNGKGVAPCSREGYPGHWVVKFSGGYAPKCFTLGGASVITDPQQVLRGYYLRVQYSVAGNGSPMRPGIFINPHLVELVAKGEIISTGPDPRAVFSAPPPVLPPGAQSSPGAGAFPPIAPQPEFTAPPPPPPQTEERYVCGTGTYTRAQLLANGWSEAAISGLARA